MKLQSWCLPVKAWPELEAPLPRWFTYMAGKWVLAVYGTPQFLTLYTSCATWMISWYVSWLLPEVVIQERVRWKLQCLLWSSLANQILSFWIQSIGHVGQSWFSVAGYCLRRWGLLGAFWRLTITKVLCLKIWNSIVCVCFLPFPEYLPCIKNCGKCFRWIITYSFHKKYWDKCNLTNKKPEAKII